MTALIKPKFFPLFRYICIVLGCIGIIGTGILWLMSTIPSMKAMAEGCGDSLYLYTDIIWITQNIVLIVAGIWIFKLKEIARISILLCMFWSLLQTVTAYYYWIVVSAISFFSFPSLLTISFCLTEILILLYYMSPDVKEYIRTKE